MSVSEELVRNVKLLPKQFKAVSRALKAIRPISIPSNFRPVFPEEIEEMEDFLDRNNASLYRGDYYKYLRASDKLSSYIDSVLKDPTKATYEGELMLALIAIFTFNMVLTVMHQAYKRATVEGQGDKRAFLESYDISTIEIGLSRKVFAPAFKGILNYIYVSYPDVSQDAFTTDEIRRLRMALVKLYGLKIG